MGGTDGSYTATLTAASFATIPPPGRQPSPVGTLTFHVEVDDLVGNTAVSSTGDATMERCP